MEQKITYHLEIAERGDFRPSGQVPVNFEVRRVEIPCPEFNWFMHQTVGIEFRWGGREKWGQREWSEYVDRPELETWVAYVRGSPAGYFELERQKDESVRIECFGLRSPFIGQRLGGVLLTRAVGRCWEMGANRVWLTTCSHDHLHALQNYLSRGFKILKKTTDLPNSKIRSDLFGRNAN